MERLAPAILALLIASLITALELVTARYPRTFFLLTRNRTFYFYVFIYGIIGFAVLLALDALINAGTVKLDGLGLDSPWVRAFVVGVTVSPQEKAAFENDVDKADSVTEAMELFLRFLGRSTFERVFPV